jgi:hypothetical protein
LAAAASSAPQAGEPSPVFVDVTRAAGLEFRHVNGSGGPEPRRYYIETMGSGAAFVDYDRDGWLDIYLVNGQHLAEPAQPPQPRPDPATRKVPRFGPGSGDLEAMTSVVPRTEGGASRPEAGGAEPSSHGFFGSERHQ